MKAPGFNPDSGVLPDTSSTPEFLRFTRGGYPGEEEKLLLAGRRAIVTGGGKGIGKGISKSLAAAGASVVIVGNLNMAMAEATADEIRADGGKAYCIGIDLARRESAAEVAAFAAEKLGGIDILVNNAAYQPNMDIDEYCHDTFKNVIDINLAAYIRMAGACLPYLKQCGAGRIVNISSVHGKRVGGFDIGYSTAKGGISMFTREAAVALQEFGITVNAILPGGTAIEFKSGVTHEWKGIHIERERKFRRYFRSGYPADSGNYTVFLCSELGEHITGTQTRVDGGLVLY